MIVSDNRVADFAASFFGEFCPPYTCLGLEKDGQIVAAAILNHYEGTDIHLTAAGRFWTRQFLRELGRYVFGQLGCLRMTAITEDPQVVALSLRIGGVVEGRMRNHFGPGRDGIIIGFLKEEWRY